MVTIVVAVVLGIIITWYFMVDEDNGYRSLRMVLRSWVLLISVIVSALTGLLGAWVLGEFFTIGEEKQLIKTEYLCPVNDESGNRYILYKETDNRMYCIVHICRGDVVLNNRDYECDKLFSEGRVNKYVRIIIDDSSPRIEHYRITKIKGILKLFAMNPLRARLTIYVPGEESHGSGNKKET